MKKFIVMGACLTLLIWPTLLPKELSSPEYCAPPNEYCQLITVPRGLYIIKHPNSYLNFALHHNEDMDTYPSKGKFCRYLRAQIGCMNEAIAIPLSLVGGGFAGWGFYKLLLRKKIKSISRSE